MDDNLKSENSKNIGKSIILSLVICCIGLMLAGGTYAYFTMAFNATNSNIVTDTRCFNINYTDNTDQITGTLWPSAGPAKGLSGSIVYQANTSCGVSGRGTFKLMVANGTSSTLTNVVAPHCENKYTKETVRGFDEVDCSFNDSTEWVTNGTALKYAIFDSTTRNHIYAAGYIDSSFIGAEKTIHSDFSVTTTSKTYYIYIWLDGNVSDDTYANLPFSATSRLDVIQVASNPDPFTGDTYTEITNNFYDYNEFDDLYQRIEYVESSGSQYIDTGIIPNQNTGVYIDFMPLNTIPVSSNSLFYINSGGTSGNTRFLIGTYNQHPGGDLVVGADNTNDPGLSQNTRTKIEIKNGKLTIDGGTEITLNSGTFTSSNSLYVFAAHASPVSRFSSMKLYSLHVYDGNNLVREYIPCKDGNLVGLYETVTKNFYVSAGSDPFIAGPNVTR